MGVKKFAKKSLGQHFLKSRFAVRHIIDTADVHPNDVVLEIGPGTGTVTHALLEKAARVVAVEKDEELVLTLQEKFQIEIAKGHFELILGDILDFDPRVLKAPYTVVGNIPYYITGAIIEKFLSAPHQPERMVLLVQKEVAARIACLPAGRRGKQKGSILSMSVRAYGDPKFVKTVSAKNFSPVPKVDSAILRIENISKKNFKRVTEETFFSVLKLGFSHKRKRLVGNLSGGYPPELISKVFPLLNISPNARAEDLTITQWFALARKLAG